MSSSDSDSESDSDLSYDREDAIRKKLMESFYGGGGGGGAAAPTTPSTTTPSSASTAAPSINPSTTTPTSHNLDSPTFSHISHISHTLLTSPLSTLLTLDQKLVNSIKRLDSTMQTLVYENYSKFITATTSIRSIGVSSSEFEPRLKELLISVGDVAVEGRNLDADLEPARIAVKEKARVRDRLRELEALLTLPGIVRGCVDRGE